MTRRKVHLRFRDFGRYKNFPTHCRANIATATSDMFHSLALKGTMIHSKDIVYNVYS